MGNLISVLTSPAQTFERMREQKGGWFGALLVITAVSLLSVWLLVPTMHAMVETQLQQAGDLGAEGEAVTGMLSTVTVYASYLIAAIGPVFGMFFVGLLLLLVNLIVRGEATYMQLSKVALFASVPGVIGGVITGILARVTGATDVADVMLNAGAFLDTNTGFLYGLLSLLDPFRIWGLVLLVIGTAVMAKRPSGKVAVWVIAGWLIVSLIGVLFAGIGAMMAPQA